MSLLPVLALLALVTSCGLIGGGLLTRLRPQPEPPTTLVWALVAGLVLLHLYLSSLDLLALRWSRLSVWLPLLLAAAACGALGLRRAVFRRPRPGWGDGVAALTLLPLALFAGGQRIVNPDFIYHWGIKGKKFALAGGVDYDFLAIPWNYYVHPDYPNLLPETFALLAIAAGRFAEPAMLLFSVVIAGALLLVVKRLLAVAGATATTAQLAIAFIALAVCHFSISWQMAGNADTLMSLALALGALCLLAKPQAARDWQVGIAAAFGAAVKIEGVAFAGILLALYLARRWRLGTLDRRSLARSLVLPLAVVAPWWTQVVRYDLRQEYYTGSFELDRLATVPRAMLDISLHDGWHGVSLLCLPLLVALLLKRASRWVAALLALQLAFYLFSYLTAPVDTTFLVRTSFPRLMLHLAPTILALGAAAAERWLLPAERPASAPR